MNSNNNNNSNLSSPSYTSKNLVDNNTEILANSYSYSIDNSYEPALTNSKFYISSNSPNSSNDSTSSNFSIRNQSRSCQNLSNSNVSNSSIDKTKPPSNLSNKEQKSSGNYFAAKLKGLKKGVEKLVTNHSKKKHDSNHNDIRSTSNHSLNSSNSQSTLASNLGASNSSNTNKKYEYKNVEERSINGGHTPTTPTYDYSYQHQQSTSSETNAQGHSARSTNISDDEADDSASLHSAHSYTLKNTNGDSKYVVPFSQSKSLQESSNKNVKIINSKFTQPNDILDKQDQFELNKKLALIAPNGKFLLFGLN
jgi:trimeric autotransporter adhesin